MTMKVTRFGEEARAGGRPPGRPGPPPPPPPPRFLIQAASDAVVPAARGWREHDLEQRTPAGGQAGGGGDEARERIGLGPRACGGEPEGPQRQIGGGRQREDRRSDQFPRPHPGRVGRRVDPTQLGHGIGHAQLPLEVRLQGFIPGAGEEAAGPLVQSDLERHPVVVGQAERVDHVGVGAREGVVDAWRNDLGDDVRRCRGRSEGWGHNILLRSGLGSMMGGVGRALVPPSTAGSAVGEGFHPARVWQRQHLHAERQCPIVIAEVGRSTSAGRHRSSLGASLLLAEHRGGDDGRKRLRREHRACHP